MDGLYEFYIKSPFGNIKTLINIVTNGNTFSGYIDMMGKRNEFNNGVIQGNNLSISGRASTGIMNIQYNITGYVQGNNLILYAQTNMGNFNLTGTKIN